MSGSGSDDRAFVLTPLPVAKMTMGRCRDCLRKRTLLEQNGPNPKFILMAVDVGPAMVYVGHSTQPCTKAPGLRAEPPL